MDPSKSVRIGETENVNPHVVHVVNHNLKLMKTKYCEINSFKNIKFLPFVSVIGIGTLGSEILEETDSLANSSSSKFDSVLQKSCARKDFFDANEVFEKNDGIVRPRFEEIVKQTPTSDHIENSVTKNQDANANSSNPNQDKPEKFKPPPGLVSFASIIRSVKKN